MLNSKEPTKSKQTTNEIDSMTGGGEGDNMARADRKEPLQTEKIPNK